MENSNTNIKRTKKNKIFTFIRQNAYIHLFKKYTSGIFSYNIISINHIMFNKSCLVVSKFKDYLIYDDNAEFVLNYYTNKDNFKRLRKILNIYEKYSTIFPNYLVFKENKYMYRNIRKKQKMIDAYNRIKEEEENNKKKIKKEGDNNKNENNNKIFTNSVKEEIKLFLKNTTFRKYKNSLDSSDNKENTFMWNCSLSINLLNKKNLVNNSNKDNGSLKGKSFDSIWTDETNGTLSNLVNIMNDNKIQVKELHHIFRIKQYSDNSNILKKNDKDKDKDKDKDNNNDIDFNKVDDINYHIKNKLNYLNCNNNIQKKINRVNKNHGVILKNMMLTPDKNKEEVILRKNNLTSTLISTKKVKEIYHSLNNFNYNSNSIIEKPITHKKNIILSSKVETINNNYNCLSPVLTSRCDQKASKLLLNNNLNCNLKVKNYNSAKENKNKKYLYSRENRVSINQNKNNSKNFNYIKKKHISHDFTHIRQIENKYINSYTNRKIRELSPQLKVGSRKKNYVNKILKDLKYNVFDKTNNSNFTKLNLKSINNNTSKIKFNLIKNKDFIKNNILKKIDKSKEKDIDKYKILKNNYKKLYSKSKFNISEYLLNFINRIKTETDTTNQITQKNKGNKKLNLHFIQNKNINRKKNHISEEKRLVSLSKSKEKDKDKEIVKKKFSHQIRKLIKTKTNLKGKHRKISSIICPSIKNISNYYINKDLKDSKNNINYTTISSKNGNNILLSSNRKNQESNDLRIGFSKHKKVFLNMNTIKRKTIIKSPFSSLNIIKDNNNNNNKKLYNLKEKIQKSNANNYLSINKSDTKSKYKNFLHKKYIKKSYDLNQEIKNKSKINILNKINTINTNNLYLSIFENNSNSIELNHDKKNNELSTNELSIQSKKKDNSKRDTIFKKVMSLKIHNLKRRKEGKITKNNIIKNDNNLPLSLRIDTNNFLSKFKGK